MPFTLDKLRQRVGLLQKAAWREIVPLDNTLYLPTSPSPVSTPADVRNAAWQPLGRGDLWGERWQTVWLRQSLTIPPALRGQPVALHLRWRSEAKQWAPDLVETQVFWNDQPYGGLDGEHRLLFLPQFEGSTDLFLQVHAGQPQPFGGLELIVLDHATDQLAHTFRVVLDAVALLDPSNLAHSQMVTQLNAAYNLLDLREGASTPQFYESVQAACVYLDQHLLANINAGTRPHITVTGHAHIDVAWLWPLWRTRQKTAHTFSTVLRLMDQYPEYHFTASTPQLYEFVQQDYPALYEEIKGRVRDGRWEPIGGMWVEADCNLPSGEALVRQFLFGMRFFADEFGIQDRVLWMPDVFGYSAALPQILRGCGINTFMTTKISWSQFNRMPFDTFTWRGIDGSDVLAHFVTTPDPNNGYYTYNGPMSPKDAAYAWREYRQKAINDELLYLMGYGDGGGGPTSEQLETVRRLADLPGLPQVRHGSAADYFDRLHQRVDQHPQLPLWVGELYLEYHRGTYTSQGWIKQANRRAEQLFHDAEFLDAWATTLGGYQSQREQINAGWKLILLNQFHDILPGSSIAPVYADARAHFAQIDQIGQTVRAAAIAAITQAHGAQLVAINTLGWQRSDPVWVPAEAAAAVPSDLAQQPITRLDGSAGSLIAGVGVPSYGLIHVTQPTTPSPATVPLLINERQLENSLYRITFDDAGEIVSLIDKRIDRELVLSGQRANQLIAFEDRPLNYDAWDIDIFYAEKAYPIQDVQSITVIENGPIRGGIEIIRQFLNSTIRQRILIYADLPRIDFETEIDWHDHQLLVKAAFPVAINAARATHEIQFGAVERPTHRNTSWDVARFETCAHKWIDLSEGDYGVALLNDSKYGHDVLNNVMRLTLLKSGVYPDPDADQGVQRFSYALLPHIGDWRAGEVVRRAAELNVPLLAVGNAGEAVSDQGVLPPLAQIDAAHVVLDTIKTAEDGDGLIVRLYEAHNQRGPLTLTFAQPIRSVHRCSLLEQSGDELDVAGSTVHLVIHPFEIVSLRVRLG